MKLNKTIATILFYALYLCTSLIVNHFSPSGPCTPGLGFMMFLGFLPISGLLFFRSIFKYYVNPERERVYCTGIHLLIFIGFLIFIRMA